MSFVRLTSQGHVLRVQLARPQARNAFDAQAVIELTQAFRGIDAQVRAVVLEAEGKAFCAGADLAWMRESAALDEAGNLAEASALAALFEAVAQAPCVVIGRVQGAAMGGGLGLVACCDVVFAAADARFGFSEVRLGLVPAVVSPYALRKIGVSAARRYFLTGEVFDATEAKRLGLVHEVVDAAELDARVSALIETLSGAGPHAIRAAKELIRKVSAENDPAELRAYTSQVIAALRVSPEGQEGLRAFLEKRAPRWA